MFNQNQAARDLLDGLDGDVDIGELDLLTLLDAMATVGLEFAQGSAASLAYQQAVAGATD